MTALSPPVLDPRDAAGIVADLIADAGAFVPGWKPEIDPFGRAVLESHASMLAAYLKHLNAAPNRHRVALLDMLGVERLPAQAARAPVVFTPLPTGRDTSVPQGSRVGGKPLPQSGGPGKVEFETERTIALAAARLAELHAVHPGQDSAADHSAAAIGGRSFTMFDGLSRVPHALYLGDGRMFQLPASAVLHVQCELAETADHVLNIAWELWNGDGWWPFANVEDGTAGLTRSGVVRLQPPCGGPRETTVDGIRTRWIRARLDEPLPPRAVQTLPQIRAVRVWTSVAVPVEGRSVCDGGLLPDRGIGDGRSLDFTKTFYPLGRQPRPGSACFIAADEAFARSGARATLCISRARTQEEEVADEVAILENQVHAARTDYVTAVDRLAKAIRKLARVVTDYSDDDVSSQFALGRLNNALGNLNDLSRVPAVLDAVEDVQQTVQNLLPLYPAWMPWYVEWLGATPPYFSVWSSWLPTNWRFLLHQALTQIQATADQALSAINDLTAAMQRLNAIAERGPDAAARAVGAYTALPTPILAWEYWDGSNWATLPDLGGSGRGLSEGTITFTVPHDWEPCAVNGTTARWLRIRLVSGSFDQLRVVSSYDTQTKRTNYTPVIDARPPALDVLRVGYASNDPSAAPEYAITQNHFEWRNETEAVRLGSRTVTPFQPMQDVTPTLYFGFDRPLPADRIGLLLDLAEQDSAGPRLTWEYWAGIDWRPLNVEDETQGFSRTGIVFVLYPGTSVERRATVASTAADTLTLTSASDAARFAPGDRVWIEASGEGQLATVQSVEGPRVRVSRTLMHGYGGGTMGLPLPPLFGRPRTWIRARLVSDGEPPASQVNGVHLNAVWASQRVTVTNENLGGSDGSPGQVHFFRQSPVLRDITLEVRELEGRLAAVEGPVVREELLRSGVADEDIREVRDPLGRTRELWVRWREEPILAFASGGDRAYSVDRALGRIIFGDDQHGRIPRAGADNIRAVRYSFGGGSFGNLPRDCIRDVLSGVLAQGVTNPCAAQGGSEGESEPAVLHRGAETIRHRRQAITVADYEALAREASPEVALARLLTARASGRRVLSLMIVPHSHDPRPQPSAELRRRVREFVVTRAPAAVASRLRVVGPTYVEVGVRVLIKPATVDDVGAVKRRVEESLSDFLHPLKGLHRSGAVFASDCAAAIEAIEGVDAAIALDLMVGGQPVSLDSLLPPGQLVCAGQLDVRLAGEP